MAIVQTAVVDGDAETIEMLARRVGALEGALGDLMAEHTRCDSRVPRSALIRAGDILAHRTPRL